MWGSSLGIKSWPRYRDLFCSVFISWWVTEMQSRLWEVPGFTRPQHVRCTCSWQCVVLGIRKRGMNTTANVLDLKELTFKCPLKWEDQQPESRGDGEIAPKGSETLREIWAPGPATENFYRWEWGVTAEESRGRQELLTEQHSGTVKTWGASGSYKADTVAEESTSSASKLYHSIIVT